ncbi:hypothetical protein AAFF_G00126270 [Aldrovandia affinis]|uniref:Apolipoprotein A-II n=1 Tax=Aldrovandia affinis TaxID=143900 RepID=A0AAD7W9G7_9TELE|nr:hypothetical protein AAFF_G00126270 [Aldrovandia affinis]
MSGKLWIAAILALQVSACLCDLPQPQPDLVAKYDELKTAFYKRLLNAYGKLQGAVGPISESIPESEAAKGYIEEARANPHVKSLVKIATSLAEDVQPVIDKARTTVLGLYGQYVRPYAGQHLDQAITAIRGFLDTTLPIEDHQ